MKPIEMFMSSIMVLCSNLCMLCYMLPVGKIFKTFSLLPGISSYNHCAFKLQAQPNS